MARALTFAAGALRYCGVTLVVVVIFSEGVPVAVTVARRVTLVRVV